MMPLTWMARVCWPRCIPAVKRHEWAALRHRDRSETPVLERNINFDGHGLNQEVGISWC
jgi:hypothetical protein